MLTTEGTQMSSSFAMVQLDGQWKPILAMGWHYPRDLSPFFASPMFGPTIDLERQYRKRNVSLKIRRTYGKATGSAVSQVILRWLALLPCTQRE